MSSGYAGKADDVRSTPARARRRSRRRAGALRRRASRRARTTPSPARRPRRSARRAHAPRPARAAAWRAPRSRPSPSVTEQVIDEQQPRLACDRLGDRDVRAIAVGELAPASLRALRPLRPPPTPARLCTRASTPTVHAPVRGSAMPSTTGTSTSGVAGPDESDPRAPRARRASVTRSSTARTHRTPQILAGEQHACPDRAAAIPAATRNSEVLPWARCASNATTSPACEVERDIRQHPHHMPRPARIAQPHTTQRQQPLHRRHSIEQFHHAGSSRQDTIRTR